jgi:hypothetical protein
LPPFPADRVERAILSSTPQFLPINDGRVRDRVLSVLKGLTKVTIGLERGPRTRSLYDTVGFVILIETDKDPGVRTARKVGS